MSLPAALGLTTTQASSVWGDAGFVITNLFTGTYGDDALGSILNSADNMGEATFIQFCPFTLPTGSFYLTSDRTNMADNINMTGNFLYTELGSIETVVGTEYIYRGDFAGETSVHEILSSNPVHYLRFWDGDPTLYSGGNTAPGVTINSINLRS